MREGQFADAAGLSSVADLGKVMSGNFEGLAGNMSKAPENEKMENMQADFMGLTDEIKSLLMELLSHSWNQLCRVLNQLKFVKDLSPEFKESCCGRSWSWVRFSVGFLF